MCEATSCDFVVQIQEFGLPHEQSKTCSLACGMRAWHPAFEVQIGAATVGKPDSLSKTHSLALRASIPASGHFERASSLCHPAIFPKNIARRFGRAARYPISAKRKHDARFTHVVTYEVAEEGLEPPTRGL